jgi:hypothetical protein
MYFRKNSEIYEYNTRRKCDFHVPNFNISLFKRSVMHMEVIDCTTK